jgi:hypothetical protein
MNELDKVIRAREAAAAKAEEEKRQKKRYKHTLAS